MKRSASNPKLQKTFQFKPNNFCSAVRKKTRKSVLPENHRMHNPREIEIGVDDEYVEATDANEDQSPHEEVILLSNSQPAWAVGLIINTSSRE